MPLFKKATALNSGQHSGFVASSSLCINCGHPNSKVMFAFNTKGECLVRVECDACGLNISHCKSFKSFPQYEWAYQRSMWDWRTEVYDKLHAVEGIENAGSEIRGELSAKKDSLLLPDK